MRIVSISKRKATYLGAILIIASFIFYTEDSLSFGHPDDIAPFITINTDANIAKKQGENFRINYSATDAYGSLSRCTLLTSDDGGNNWFARVRPAIPCGDGVEATIFSSWCPSEGTGICGVRITATDTFANRDQHEKFFTIDGRPPVVELSSNRSDPSEKRNVTFTFWASDEHTTAAYLASHFECKLDLGAWEDCTSPKSYNAGALPNGFRTFNVRATDRAGNVSLEKSVTWEIDSSPPKRITDFKAFDQTYFSVTTIWSSPDEDTSGPAGVVSSQYDIRYSAYPINGNNANDWNDKTVVIRNEPNPSSPVGTPESMLLGPPSFDRLHPELLTSYLPHDFMIKSRDEKWNWSQVFRREIATKRDPCDYDADRIFSPKLDCGPNICNPDLQTCDLYDDPFDWGLQGTWNRDKSQSYSPAGEPWIKHFSNTIDDLDEDGVSVASTRTGLPATSSISEVDFPPLEDNDWYDNPFTSDFSLLSSAPSLKQLRNTINDLDLDTFIVKEWKEIFGGKDKVDTSDKVPINADVITLNDLDLDTLDADDKNIAGCIYPEALEDECLDCTAYNPDPRTGRVPPGKIRPSIVKGKAVCQIEAYYKDIAGTSLPYEVIPAAGEAKGTIDPDRPTITASANCRDKVDNDLDRQTDTSDDIATRDIECPQEFGVSQTSIEENAEKDSEIATISHGQAAVFPSAGLVQCGRNADDFTTPIDESADCGFCHFFFLIDNILKLIIGRLMPILVVLSFLLGGFLILLSRGNVSQVLRGRKAMQWAVMAYIASLLAWTVLNAFFSIFGIVGWTGFLPTRGEITELQSTSVTDATKNWKIDEWAGYPVEIQPPKGSSMEPVVRRVFSNNTDTLSLFGSQPFPDDPGYRYYIIGTGWWSFTCNLGISGVTANFEASPQNGVAPFTVDFTDLSTGDIDGWLWDFGDGTTSSDKSPRHTYITNGPHLVRLTVRGGEGNNTITQNINHAPTANFDVLERDRHGRTPWTVDFKDTSTGVVGEWLWDFGDGATSNDKNPSHTYIDPGPYVVKLRVSGPVGYDTKTEINYIFVYPTYPEPKAKFSHSIIPDTLMATTTNESLVEDGFLDGSTMDDITNWLWEFKNNDTGVTETTSVKEPTYSFATNKKGHTISLTALGPGGEHKVSEIIIFPPGANFTASPQGGHLSSGNNFKVSFTDTSTGTASGWLWDFGDGATSNEQNPSHTYFDNGSRTVRLEVKNPLGATSTKIISDYIVVAPGAYFEADPVTGPAPLNVAMENKSWCLGDCSWLWQFGDETTSDDRNPSHPYKNEEYELRLTVTDSDGRSHRSSSKTITSFPSAAFSVDKTNFRGKSSGTVVVEDQSATVGYLETWVLDFGDGTTEDTRRDNYSHFYDSPGNYTIGLTVMGPPDSSTAVADFVDLDFTPIADVSASGPSDRSTHSGTIDFDASGSSPSPGAGGTTYSWSGCDSGSGVLLSCSSSCDSTKSASIRLSNAGGTESAPGSYSWDCPVHGCRDDSCANNYDPSVDEDRPAMCRYDSSCCDNAYDEYDLSACGDACVDSACVNLLGCTDSCASNFDPAADVDDGSCIVPACGGPCGPVCPPPPGPEPEPEPAAAILKALEASIDWIVNKFSS